MSTIRVDESAGDRVGAAADALGEQLWQASGATAGHGIGPAVVTALAGFGLQSASLTGEADYLAARMVAEAAALRSDADTARDWVRSLLDSQVAPSHASAWADAVTGFDLFLKAKSALTDNIEAAPWWARSFQYLRVGTLEKHASTWKPMGYADRKLTAGFSGLLGVAGAFVPGAAGTLTSAIGNLGTAAAAVLRPDLVKEALKGEPVLAKPPPGLGLASKVAGKLNPVLIAASVGVGTYNLTHGDLHQVLGGDGRHSQTTRDVLYAAKVADTLGSAMLLAAPVPGVGTVVAVAGGALIGASALVEGGFAVFDMVHDTRR